jgi:hypothetical protein
MEADDSSETFVAIFYTGHQYITDYCDLNIYLSNKSYLEEVIILEALDNYLCNKSYLEEVIILEALYNCLSNKSSYYTRSPL